MSAYEGKAIERRAPRHRNTKMQCNNRTGDRDREPVRETEMEEATRESRVKELTMKRSSKSL